MPARQRRYGGRPLPSVSAEEDAERKGITGKAKQAYIGGAIQRAKAGNETKHAEPEHEKPKAQKPKTERKRRGETSYGRVPQGYKVVGERKEPGGRGFEYLEKDGDIYRRNESNPMGFRWVTSKRNWEQGAREDYIGEGMRHTAPAKESEAKAEPEKQREPEPEAKSGPSREGRIEAGTQRRIHHQRPRSEITTTGPGDIKTEGLSNKAIAQKISHTQERQAAALRSLAEEDTPQREAQFRAEKDPAVARLDAEVEELWREREDEPHTPEEIRTINARMRDLAQKRKAAYDPIYKRELAAVKAERPAPPKRSIFKRKPKPQQESNVKISKILQDPDTKAALDEMERLKAARDVANGAEYRRLDQEVRAAYQRYLTLRNAQDAKEQG